MTDAERFANVVGHVQNLGNVLSRVAPAGITQRIYRSRAILNNEFVLFTLIQNLPNHQSLPDQIRIFAASPHSGSDPIATLTGQYCLDAIVAFLGLDVISPQALEWTDETRYTSNLLVASSIVSKLH